jgi:hypothetical protein
MNAVIGAGPFGDVPNTLVDTVTMEGLETLFTEIINSSKMVNSHEQWQKLHNEEDYLKKLDAFRTGVGALYLKILRQIDKDRRKAHRVSNSFWKCMAVSLFSRTLKPQKYYNICGSPLEGYQMMVLRLANLPGDHQNILDRWKDSHSTKPFVSAILGTRQTLMEREREYRDTAIAIAQIGIGVGGMLLGLLGLLLSLILSYTIPAIFDLKTDRHISAIPQGGQPKPVLDGPPPVNKFGGAPIKDAK